MSDDDLKNEAINTIRFLSADAVQRANSGHPGLPMGAAPMAYVLWMNHMRFDPQAPSWPNRDRFVLSAGHGSMLLYSLLHLFGFDLSLDDIKNFRQLGSPTAGHPEYWEVPGIETTTGPLGQGFGNGVGMAIAAEHMAALYNREGYPLFNNRVYAIVSDGDLMEGVSHEAAALAGHLRLGSLTYLYDDNHITIDGSTDLAWSEDRQERFRAYGWHVQAVDHGDDLQAIDRALRLASDDPRPSLIAVRTIIGRGLPTKQGTSAAHGEPPGEEELRAAKEALGWPLEPRFLIPEAVAHHFRERAQAAAEAHRSWVALYARYQSDYPDLAKQLDRTLAGELPVGLEQHLPEFPADQKGLATRASSGTTLSAIAKVLPELIGGSADLTGSNKTDIKGEGDMSADDKAARYIHYGVREHGMGAILNGLALFSGLRPYGGTFLIFSDYMRPTIRLAAMMGICPIYVFTHDSIGLGEDGPTHQPVEQLASLRAIPNMTTIRPADAAETAQAWLAALKNRSGPTALVLTRQRVPTLDRARFGSAEGLHQGAYVLADLGEGEPDVILMASGSEVQTIIEAGQTLSRKGIAVRLVSMPSWELFAAQDEEYKQRVLPDRVNARVSIEAAAPLGWKKWVGDRGVCLGMFRFGESAPYKQIYQDLGLIPDSVVRAALSILEAGPTEGEYA